MADDDVTKEAASDGRALTLEPPAPVAVVSPDEAAGLVPIEDRDKSALEQRVDSFVAQLVAENPNSPAFGQRVDQLAALGRQEIQRAADHAGRFLGRPVRAIDSETGIGADLTALRRQIEDLDPSTHGDLLTKKRLFGIIPFGNKARAYFDSYQSAQSHISAILARLEDGKDTLLRDNAAIDVERRALWDAMGKLEQMVYMAKLLDRKLEAAANAADDPAQKKAIRESALFYTRQRMTDLLTQMAVTVQGYLALDLVKKNNRELVKGVDRASSTTVAALRTAVTVAQALTSEKLVLDQITALNTTTGNVIAATGKLLKEQTGAIHQQAASATVPVATLQQAFADIYDTMDQIDSFREKALGAMQQTVDALSTEVEKARAYVARADDGDRKAIDAAGDNPLLAIEDKNEDGNAKGQA